MIPYSRQSIDDDDVEAVAEALRSDWLTTGPFVDRFETAIVEYTGARHAIAIANGTAALHACMVAGGIRAGDRVTTSPLSFSASANCARYVGADTGFLDLDPSTLNMNLRELIDCDALVAVHYAGLPVDLRQLRSRPRIVIEDAAQALGARTPDGPVGNCAHSDMTVFSFHPVKSITTGEGGVITTNDDDLAYRLRRFRSHGIEHDVGIRPWEYDIVELGFNYRLTDIQAALGWSQMRKLDSFIVRRNELADIYDAAFTHPALIRPPTAMAGFRHARHLYPIRVDRRDDLYRLLRDAGIGVQVHHVPIYRLSVYGLNPTSWPETERAYERVLSLPLHPELSLEEQSRVIDQVLSFVDRP